ncbi:unnamed protein product [Dovyalis caffra]|uniref:Uncharacterized protein n=1 Tax=Dovyalis caffra TaxID=77055 RepID=A0AAV1R7R5_9ROSI|nr:unnamed protein product [Dovyalis caffra]
MLCRSSSCSPEFELLMHLGAQESSPILGGLFSDDMSLNRSGVQTTIAPSMFMLSVEGINCRRNEDWDEESQAREGEDYAPDGAVGDSDDNLKSPLISRLRTSMDKDMVPPAHISILSGRTMHGGDSDDNLKIRATHGGDSDDNLKIRATHGGDSDDNLKILLISRLKSRMVKDMVPPAHISMSNMRHVSLITGNIGGIILKVKIGMRRASLSGRTMSGGDSDDNLKILLISRLTSNRDKDMVPPAHISMSNMRHVSLITGNVGGNHPKNEDWDKESQVSLEDYAWYSIDLKSDNKHGQGHSPTCPWNHVKHETRESDNRKCRRSVIQFVTQGLVVVGSWHGNRPREKVRMERRKEAFREFVCINREPLVLGAAALLSQSALYRKELVNEHPVGPAMVHPSETAAEGPSWRDLFEPGVRHALAVVVGLQILQQFAGINGVLYYTPQILEQAGVGVLSNLGLSSASTSLLISALTSYNNVDAPLYSCCHEAHGYLGEKDFAAQYHPRVYLIPRFVGPWKLEIFSTRVRGLCVAICALTFWIGLAGVFGLYAVVCIISFVLSLLESYREPRHASGSDIRVFCHGAFAGFGRIEKTSKFLPYYTLKFLNTPRIMLAKSRDDK